MLIPLHWFSNWSLGCWGGPHKQWIESRDLIRFIIIFNFVFSYLRQDLPKSPIPFRNSVCNIFSRRAQYPAHLSSYSMIRPHLCCLVLGSLDSTRIFSINNCHLHSSCQELWYPYCSSWKFVLYESVLLCISWQVGHEVIRVRTDGRSHSNNGEGSSAPRMFACLSRSLAETSVW